MLFICVLHTYHYCVYIYYHFCTSLHKHIHTCLNTTKTPYRYFSVKSPRKVQDDTSSGCFFGKGKHFQRIRDSGDRFCSWLSALVPGAVMLSHASDCCQLLLLVEKHNREWYKYIRRLRGSSQYPDGCTISNAAGSILRLL